jgi:DNA repair protein RecN (Recombination protein N)
LAAFGEQHLQVSKQIQDGRTLTHVTTLNEGARLAELAQMLGESSDGTKRTAQDMLQAAMTLTERTNG